MRHSLLALTAAALFPIVEPGIALGQRHEIPALSTCIREFYDPGMYNYLTFRNNCSQSLTLVFVAKDGSGASGRMDLRPGGQDSVGKLESRDPKVGDFEFYVCRIGYLPVDVNAKVVTKPGMSFQCQPKSRTEP